MSTSEAILLRQFTLGNDAEAFAKIVQLHAPMVYGACLRILADKDKASDAVQDTFVQLVHDAGNITGSLPSWLHRVATHKSIDLLRSDSRRRRREAKYANRVDSRTEQETSTWQEISGYIDEELDQLDDQIREILILRFFNGLTTTDIAERCNISQPTVIRRLKSGVSFLRHKLKARGLVVSSVILVGMLKENFVKAAPAVVMRELGKIAIAGNTVVPTGSVIGTAVSALAGLALEIKIIAAAAILTITAGSTAIYYHSNRQPEVIDEILAPEALAEENPQPLVSEENPEPLVPEDNTEPLASEENPEPLVSEENPEPVDNPDIVPPPAGGMAAAARGAGGAAFGGYARTTNPNGTPSDPADSNTPPAGAVGGMGFGGMQLPQDGNMPVGGFGGGFVGGFVGGYGAGGFRGNPGDNNGNGGSTE